MKHRKVPFGPSSNVSVNLPVSHPDHPKLSTVLLVLLLAWLLIGPRVELAQVSGSSVRLEDFILFGIGFFVVSIWPRVRSKKLIKPGIALVLAASLFAAGLGSFYGRTELLPSVLYALRPVEYWVVYPAVAIILAEDGWHARKLIWRCLLAVTYLQAIVAALQYLGGFELGFSSSSNDRGAGLSAGPYELGAICSMLACFWLYKKRYVTFAVAIAGVLMSQSRVSLLGLLVGILVVILSRQGRTSRAKLPVTAKKANPVLIVGSTIFLVIGIVFSPYLIQNVFLPGIDRVQETSILSSWRESGYVVNRTPRLASASEYSTVAYEGIGENILQSTTSSDASNVVRFYRWQLLIREVTDSPEKILFGVGPSYAGPSVDGAWLRIFVEAGLVGLAAWTILAARWIRGREAWFIGAVVTILIGSVFIDLMFAMRPMLLLWVMSALAYSKSKNFS